MKNALVIAAREFEEKRFVAYTAVACAILPSLLTIIPGIHFRSPREVIALSALIAASGFTLALAIMSGASFVGRDLSDGRMSFYFSRPVASASIWFGKLTAGILMLVGCFAVIVAPGWLAVTRTMWTSVVTISLEKASVLILAVALALFLLAHAISTFARSRSPLIVFDFAAALICGVVIRLLIVPLIAGDAYALISKLSIALGIAAAVGIAGGGAWQLERGRTDRRRSHLALSQFLWSTLAAALLIAAAYVAWVVSIKPGDLTAQIQANRSTSGPFAIITGTAKGRADYHGAFLLDTEDGSTWRVDPWSEAGVRYTRNGRSAVVPRRGTSAAEIVVYTRGKTEPADTGLTISSGDYFVDDDGGRIATISNQHILSVYDVASKRSLASVMLPNASYVRKFFLTPDVVRLYLSEHGGMKIMEFDVPSRALRETGFIASPGFINFFTDPAGQRMVVMRSGAEDVLTLNDARTGAPIKTLANGTRLKTARFLRDGRIAFIDGPDTQPILHILASDGTPQRDIPLGAKKRTMIMGDDGTRVVLNEIDLASGRRVYEAVNITSGVVERRQPIRDWVSSGSFETRPAIEPLRELFYVADNGGIVAWSPATGNRRMITGA
jgi:ABC-type transport system involved in multi-copper enzyme maturation permease subunit